MVRRRALSMANATDLTIPPFAFPTALRGAAADDGGDPDPTSPRDVPPPSPASPGRIRRAVEAIGAWLFAIGVLALSGAVAWSFVEPQLTKPYVYDEAAFAFAGHAVATTGLPFSNLGHLQTLVPGDFSQRFNWALWHPPLYVYALGEAYARFGETERTARLLGVATSAVAGLLVFLTTLAVTRTTSRGAPVFAAIGAALYVTNPFTVQSALLLDIDGTVLVAAIALAMFTYVLLLGNTRPLRHPLTWIFTALATVAVALCLWAKMTTVLAVVAAATGYRLVGQPWRPWRLLIELPLVVGGGTILFLGTWWWLADHVGMPFGFPFRVLWLEFEEAVGSTTNWKDDPVVVLDLLSQVALWISPYLFALFIGAGTLRFGEIASSPIRWFRTRNTTTTSRSLRLGLEPVDFVLIAGAGTGLVYLIKLAGSFPKYHITMMPFVAVGVGYLLARVVGQMSWWEAPAYTVVLGGMVGYFSLAVGDSMVLFRGYDWVLPLLAWPGVAGFGFLVLATLLGRHYLPRQLAIYAVILTAAWSWGVNVAQADTAYSTAYHYGVHGQREAAAYLDTVLERGERYVAAREVAYYAREDSFIDQDVWWADIEARSAAGVTTFDGQLLGTTIDILALFLWDPILGRIAHGYLDDRYEVAYQAGVFVVFVRTS
jgi:hypothetical protein